MTWCISMRWRGDPLTTNYREVAESIRVCSVIGGKKAEVIENLLRKNHLSQWKIVYLLYPPSSQTRLSDEDFREIYYLLTLLYPEEVEPDPDPINLLAYLSNAKKTTAITDRVYDITSKVLVEGTDNKVRAMLLRPLFARLTREDMFYALMRMSVRGSSIKRHDVVKALGRANGKLLRNVRKASMLIGMEKVCDRLSRGEEIQDIITPAFGRPLILPSPSVATLDALPFGKCFMEIPEGQWMTLHVLDDAIMLFDAGGAEIEVEYSTLNMVKSAGVDKGIYLVEYATGRDMEIQIIDQLNQENDMTSFAKRREALDCRSWAIKPMKELTDASYYMESVGTTQPVLLWNYNGILTYENSIYEVALLNAHKAKQSVFRVVGGVYTVETPMAAPKLTKWRVAVRDGDSYYEVGLIEAEPHVSLMRFVKPHKIVEGEEVAMISPVFVKVKVIGSGWGDYGAYIQGVITSHEEQAGMSGCVSIDELEALSKGWDDGYDSRDREEN